ncbi:amino acid permease [Patescibacteria group bacterium]|nr:amino acid permease [Patescibacteria group bacterium]
MFDNRFINAISMLVGAIIGAGIFGLPYVAAQSGLALTLIFLVVLSAITVLMHLLYGEVVLRTNGQHRMVGYAGIYLGIWGKRISSVSTIIGTYAASLAYLILGGIFLFTLFGDVFGGDVFWYSTILFVASFIFIAKGLKIVSWIESFLTFFLIFAIFIFLTKGSFYIDVENFSLATNWAHSFLPYGVILFALSGSSIIPDVASVLGDDRTKLKKAIIWGTLIPAVIYFLFIIIIFGVSGAETSENAVSGLAKYYGNGFITLGALVGFLAVFTSLLAYGTNLKKTFQYDYGLSRAQGLILALLIPFLVLMSGANDFIRIMGFSGALMGGVDGVLLILMYRKADKGGERRPEYDIITSQGLEYFIMLIFILGFIYTVLS